MASLNFLKRKTQKLAKEEQEWRVERNIRQRYNKIEKEKKELKNERFKLKVSASKLLVAFLFISCTLIELFTGYVTIRMIDVSAFTGVFDFTPLVTLIGAVIGEVIGYGVYSLKAMKENTIGGIIYDTAMIDKDNKKTEEGSFTEEIDPNAVG